jgi:ABC-type taurine transport system ATPase subunit
LTAENGFYHTALNGVGELLGGLVQATGRDIDCRSGRAGVIVQLKRALKGLAFCRGGVFGLRSAGVLDEQSHRELQDQLKQILEHLHELLVEAWNE